MRNWQEVSKTDELDKILLAQYRRDLMPIWEGIGEIGDRVMPAEEAAEGVAGICERRVEHHEDPRPGGSSTLGDGDGDLSRRRPD